MNRGAVEGLQAIRQQVEEDVENQLDQIRQSLQTAIGNSDITITQIRVVTGIAENTVRTFLRGKTEISVARLLAICVALGISLADLLPEPTESS